MESIAIVLSKGLMLSEETVDIEFSLHDWEL